MEEEDGESFGHASLPPFVSRASFITTSISPSPRRLSSNFSEQNRPIPSARRLSWINLEGKLVNAEEASSSKAIGGSLSLEEGLAWDLFSPIQRVLIVAVVAVANVDLNKSRQIWQLKRQICQLQRSLELRNEVPLNMQHKCGCRLYDQHQDRDQRNHSEEKASSEDEMFKFKSLMLRAEQEERRMSDLSDLPSGVTSSGDIQLNTLAIEQDIYNLRKECEEKDATIKELMALVKAADGGSKRDSVEIESSEDEMFKFKPLMIEAEQEERRMSDLSDLASSVTSAADIQLNRPAMEHDIDDSLDIDNFLREFEEKDATIKEKDATIKELLAVVKATDAGGGSQRVPELEELVRRQNMIITKQKKNMSVLKKDMAVLEQKIVHLTRLRRPSTASTLTVKELPMMADNLLYDMSSTSPSSSDSDSPIENRARVLVNQEHKKTPPQDVAAKRILQTPSAKPPMSLPKSTYRPPRSRPASPLTENSMNQRPDSPSGDLIRNRRRIHSGPKDSAQSKRWV